MTSSCFKIQLLLFLVKHKEGPVSRMTCLGGKDQHTPGLSTFIWKCRTSLGFCKFGIMQIHLFLKYEEVLGKGWRPQLNELTS